VNGYLEIEGNRQRLVYLDNETPEIMNKKGTRMVKNGKD